LFTSAPLWSSPMGHNNNLTPFLQSPFPAMGWHPFIRTHLWALAVQSKLLSALPPLLPSQSLRPLNHMPCHSMTFSPSVSTFPVLS
jgi:hypothetical protein